MRWRAAWPMHGRTRSSTARSSTTSAGSTRTGARRGRRTSARRATSSPPACRSCSSRPTGCSTARRAARPRTSRRTRSTPTASSRRRASSCSTVAGAVARIAGVQGVHWARPQTPRRQDAGFGYLAASIVDALRAGRRFTVWEDPALNSVATPTLASDAAEMMWRIASAGLTGTFHCCGGESRRPGDARPPHRGGLRARSGAARLRRAGARRGPPGAGAPRHEPRRHARPRAALDYEPPDVRTLLRRLRAQIDTRHDLVSVAMTEFLGACPLDCPDTLQLGRDGRGRRGRQRARQPRPPVHRRRAVRQGQRLPRAHARARPAPAPAAAGRARRARGASSGSRWDEALDEIAARLHGDVDERGGEAIWPYQGTGTLGYLQGLRGPRPAQRLWNVLGASRHEHDDLLGRRAASARPTRPARAAGHGPGDVRATRKLILLWGTNTLTSGHHLWKFIRRGAQHGAHLVAIDPLRTRTAEHADEHLAPLPGTDAALALGLLWVVARRGRRGPRLPRASTPSAGTRSASAILEFPPDRVAAITGPRGGAHRRARAPARAHAADRRSAPRWACSATPAAAWRCARCRDPGRDRRLAVPGRRRLVYSTSGYFDANVAGAAPRRPAASARCARW